MLQGLDARWTQWEDRVASFLTPDGSRIKVPKSTARFVSTAAMCVLSLVLALIGTHNLLNGFDGYPVALRVADVVFGGIAFVAVWWRRSWPLAFGLYILVTSFFSTLVAGLTFVAVFNVAIRRRWPTSTLYSLALTLAAWPSLLIYKEPGVDNLELFAIVAVLTFAFTGWGMFVRARRELFVQLRARAERAEDDRNAQLDNARRSERERIAREMHDVLAHRLSLLAVHAGALEYRSDASAEEVTRGVSVIRSNAHEGLNELRSIVHLLRDDIGGTTAPPQPSLTDVPALVEESRVTGMPVRLDIRVNGDDVEDLAGRTLYRIMQEGLTNARKHAPGAEVTVCLFGDPSAGLTLSIISQQPVNKPAGPPPGSGTGLVGLMERAQVAGGRLDYGESPDRSFHINAWLPWRIT